MKNGSVSEIFKPLPVLRLIVSKEGGVTYRDTRGQGW